MQLEFCFAPCSDMTSVSEIAKWSVGYPVFSWAEGWSHLFLPQQKIVKNLDIERRRRGTNFALQRTQEICHSIGLSLIQSLYQSRILTISNFTFCIFKKSRTTYEISWSRILICRILAMIFLRVCGRLKLPCLVSKWWRNPNTCAICRCSVLPLLPFTLWPKWL